LVLFASQAARLYGGKLDGCGVVIGWLAGSRAGNWMVGASLRDVMRVFRMEIGMVDGLVRSRACVLVKIIYAIFAVKNVYIYNILYIYLYVILFYI
jgi:hypothetical protein